MSKSIPLRLFFILLIMAATYPSHSQEADNKRTHDFLHRISVGGNFGFQFGSVTGIVVSPEVRIRAVDQLHFGLGFTYQYLRYNDYFYDFSQKNFLDLRLNVYGGRIFSRYYLGSIFTNEILANLFAHVEYEYLTYHMPYKNAGPPPDGTIVDPYNYYYKPGNQVMEFNSFFVGGGYRQTLGGRFYVDIMILFNLNDTYNSPYANPVIRLGFGTGL